MRQVVRERISPRITASLFANYRSSADAILELVDNALDARAPGEPLSVDLTILPTSITVHSQGGAGMGPGEFGRDYLNWGASPKRRRGRVADQLGQYGQGGKAAIGFLGARFVIEASRPGEEVAWRIDDPDYRRRERLKTYVVRRVAKRGKQAEGYVRIRIDGVDKRVDEKRLASRLADSYRPLLESGALVLATNTRPVVPPPIEAADRREFRVRAAHGTLAGLVRRPGDGGR